MKTLLVISPGSQTMHSDWFSLYVAETGESLASHGCSHAGYAPGDLYYDRPERIKEFKERFGYVEVMFIDQTNISEEELLKRNKEWHKRTSNDSKI